MFDYNFVSFNQQINLQTLKYPLYVYIELTDSCNLKCKFCSVNKKNKNFISYDLLKKVLDNLKELNIMDIYYTGGEPLLHPYFDNIVDYADKLGMRQTILTNGILIDKHLESLNKMMCICISLHGTETTHNTLTGENCYHKVIENISLAKKTTNVKINYTVINENQNIKEMKQVLDYAKLHNIDVSFSKYNNIGIGKENKCSIDLKEFVKTLDTLRNKNYTFLVNDCIAPCLVEEKYLYLTHGCGAGYLFGSINYNGDVKICPSSNIILGNLNKTDFSKIWNQKLLMKFRDFEWLPLYCKSCKNLSRCRGGCKVENEKNIIEFNDYQVIINKENDWEKIKNKKLKVNISILRKENGIFISLSNPPRKFNKYSMEVIEKLNSGVLPCKIPLAKDLILAMYRDKVVLEADSC